MTQHFELEIRQQVLDEMIAEVEKSIQQFQRTVEGLQHRIAAERHHREMLERKRNAISRCEAARDESSTIADYVAKVLHEHGEPMRVQEIVRALEQNGIKSGSGDAPLNSVLSAVNRRSDLFERVARGIYALKNMETAGRSYQLALHGALTS
jgi:hypothetical protein